MADRADPSTSLRTGIGRRARLVIARELRISVPQISDNSEFRADLKADSLDVVGLTMALEMEFGVEITDDEADFCQTVGTAIDLIEAKLERREARP